MEILAIIAVLLIALFIGMMIGLFCIVCAMLKAIIGMIRVVRGKQNGNPESKI